MEYAYTVLLLNETGEEINETNITAILEAAGVVVEESRVKALVAALEDVDLEAETEDADLEAETEDTDYEATTEDVDPHEPADARKSDDSPDGFEGGGTNAAAAEDDERGVPAIPANQGNDGDGEGGEVAPEVEGDPSSQERAEEA